MVSLSEERPASASGSNNSQHATQRPTPNDSTDDGNAEAENISSGSGTLATGGQSGTEREPQGPDSQQDDQSSKKPSKLKQLWEKSGLDVYLVAIASILGFCIMPRGKFIQTMSMNIVAICLAAAVQLLALYSVTQARIHTTPAPAPGASQSQTVSYNSSASAVCGIWLMVQVFLLNALRASRPQYQFPCILYSIFVSVSLTYGVMFPNMTSVISFMKRLLEAFLTGFALATATHFLVFPMSSRKVVFKMMTGYIGLLNGTIKTQTAYMASLEEVDPVQLRKQHEREAEEAAKKQPKKKPQRPQRLYANEASVKLRGLLTKLYELHTKLNGDILPAKREVAIGKLESHDITRLWDLLRLIFVPVMGLCSMMTMFEREAESQSWGGDDLAGEEAATAQHRLDNLHRVMSALHGPFQSMSANLDEAFNHILLTLEFIQPPKAKSQDVERQDESRSAAPGSPGFAEAYKNRLDAFYDSKQQTLKDWCEEHGINLAGHDLESTPEALQMADEHARQRNQRSLFFTLYLEYCLWRVGRAVLNLVLYVDKRKQDGAFESSKVIFPGSKTLYNWIQSSVGKEDTSQEDSYAADLAPVSQSLGQAFEKKRDPEHLPPRNSYEKIGDSIRVIPEFFRSDAAAFGFRVAAATMSIAIICYLEETQDFFLRNRLLWAMIMVAISMTRMAGQSFFNFTLRIGGTAVAMVGSYIIWYIVDGHVGGVLVFLWLWVFCAFYVVIKMPKLVVVGILSLVTAVLIVAYELQVKKIGVQASESNDQPAYPLYILAPYRLATVCGGLLVAFIWTIFPYPVSEHSEVRKDLGSAMYLMGLYYHLAHEMVTSTLDNSIGDARVKGSHGSHLEAARKTVFSKLVALLNLLGTNSSFSKFQIPIGGQFPREEYEKLIECLRRLLLWISLVSYTSVSFHPASDEHPGGTQWSNDFRKVVAGARATSHRITTVFSVLSSSIRNGAPVPPHLELPNNFDFVKRMEDLDADILSIRHMAEPEYSAFAVLHIASRNATIDVEELVRHVKTLVGEIDFSFRAIKPDAMDSQDSFDTYSADSTDEKKQ